MLKSSVGYENLHSTSPSHDKQTLKICVMDLSLSLSTDDDDFANHFTRKLKELAT